MPQQRRPKNSLLGLTQTGRARTIAGDRRRFIEEGLIDEDWTRAARIIWPDEPNPHGRAVALLKSPVIASAIEHARRRALLRTDFEKAWVVNRLKAFVSADVNELVEGRRVPCRYCWGMDHRYQFRPEELRQAVAKHRDRQMALRDEERRVPFDDHGGDGYTTRRAPNPECPECDGDGVYHTIFKDTRNLSARARLLYDGIEIGPNGQAKMKIRDKAWAEAALLRHAGVAVERKEVIIRTFEPAALTDEEMRTAILRATETSTIELEDDEFEELADNEGDE
jgi:hypothetical protein